jgi:pimeloyl-ACP methyl ester carboxylesterase
MTTTSHARCAVALAGCMAALLAARMDAQIGAPQIRDAQEQTLTAHDGTPFVVMTGVIRVPELRTGTQAASGTSGTIDLAVVRVRRLGGASRTAHVVLAGGPGDSGVNLVLGMARQGGATLSDVIDGDVIGIDQRGTGKSSPNLVSAVRYDLPLDRPGSPEVWLPLMARASRAVAADFRARGVRLDAYNTRESADDVDDVRRALGYTKITLWGRSYGSHLALATLRRHPETIERLVLVSPEGPNQTWKLPSQVDAVLQRISERAQLPELRTQMRQVLDRLARTPAAVSVPHPVTGQPVTIAVGAFDVQWLTAQALGDPRTLATLPAAYREMAAGDFQRIARLALVMRTRLGVESAMKQMTDLSSGATADRRAHIDREAADALLGNAINFPGMYLREAWDAPDLGDDFRQAVTSDVPTLILVGDLDPRTPVENGREIAATLPNAQLVIVENALHQFDVFGSAPIRLLLRQFLTGARVTDTRIVLPPLHFQP